MTPTETMLIERACERLAVDFAHGVDHRETDKVVALFTPDATFERRGEVLRGQAEIRAAQEKRPKALVTRHLCTTLQVEVLDARRARGCVYFVLFRHEGEVSGPAPLGQAETVGEYHDDYVLTDAGWRIARRVAKAAFRRAAG